MPLPDLTELTLNDKQPERYFYIMHRVADSSHPNAEGARRVIASGGVAHGGPHEAKYIEVMKRVHELEGTDAGLEDLPANLLGKILGELNDARKLCDAADKLQRASREIRNDVEAWKEIASQYSMPNPPPPTANVQQWRAHVKYWCEQIRPGTDENGYALTKFSTDQCVWMNEPERYKWIHTVVSPPVPVSWIKQDLVIVSKTHGNKAFFDTAYARLPPLNGESADGRDKCEYLLNAVKYGHVDLTTWLFRKLLDEASTAVWPPDPSRYLTAEDLEYKRDRLRSDVVHWAYAAINYINYKTMLPVLEAIHPPADRQKNVMLYKAVYVAGGSEEETLAMMRFLDARYRYTRDIMSERIVEDVEVFYGNGVHLERAASEWAPYDTMALLKEWMER